ncbi:unnamed protein product [Penicillium glandicola]
MTNQENERGNSDANNQTQSSNAPAPSPSTSNTPSTPAPPSLATRIQTSATALAKTAFNPSPDIANTLATSTASKPAGPSSLPNTQTSRDLSAQNTTPQHGGPSSGSWFAAQAFREQDTSIQGGFALPALTEEEFHRGNTYEYDGIADNTEKDLLHTTTHQPQSHHETLQTPSSAWKGKARAHDPTQLQFETVWQRQSYNPATTTLTSTTDGAAVFDPNFEDPTTVPDTEIDFAAAPGPLSAGEREALDSFRKGLGLELNGGKREGDGGRLTGASLVPDIDVFLSQGVGIGEGNAIGSTSTSLRDAVLMNLPGAGDWVGVQERYHDEVWGFLQPVLEEARAEIEEKGVGEEGLAGEDGPAVRRLKMILMHMKG